ncbi:protocadherin Fat 4-like [Crassostrea angulata]|uniref:protocadherin Fat 4-like n=1 Tax=Magallana angulata TaxID=2784310 RepID=UPI0022B10021|nr:protocadherin Fat 4-like [Crassostrea angulata]
MMNSLTRFSIIIGVILLFNVERLVSGQGTRCDGTEHAGTNDPNNKNNDLDTDTGLGVLLDATDKEYMTDCCGVIESWRFYVKTNTGTVDLQVWRPDGTGSFTLVGKNSRTVSTINNEITYLVPVSERISVLDGDYLGFYTSGNPMISHKQEGGGNDRYTYSTIIGAKNVGDSFDWSAATPATESRTYAIRADLGPGNAPTFTNLPNTLTLTDDRAANTLLFTVSVNDVDPQDTPTLVGLTTIIDFTFNAANGEVKNTGALPVGTTELQFRVDDQCSGTTETLTIVVNNIPPVITNLPSTYDISEDQTAEQLLYTLTVTDGSLSDRVTCSTDSITPSTDNFFVRLIAGTTDSYGVYVKALPSLSYDSVRQYAVLISCTDTKTPVTDTLTIFVTKNNPPSFDNLPATKTVISSSTTTGSTVYTVTATDSDSPQLYFNMTCVPVTCPFVIHHSGEILATSDLTSHTVPGYDLYIYVNDGKTLVGPRTLTVIISGINTAPTITNLPLSSALSVPENGGLSASVYQVSVTDVDVGQTHTFYASYSPSTGSSLFSMNPTTGLISTSSTQAINYEALGASGRSYVITVTVTDGFDTATQSLSVAITDQNEAPVFGKASYAISGNEGNAGTTVGDPSFDVTDPDAGATKAFSIDCPSFVINSNSGVVTFSHDYDLDVAGTAPSVTCIVTVSDGDLTDTASLVITINDVNDHTPRFTSATFTFYAQPNTGVGTALGFITASDNDAGAFGTISYTLDQTGLGFEYFGVKHDGEFYVKSSLLLFSSGTTLSLSTVVKDSGGLQDTAAVTVIIPESTTAAPTTTTDRHVTFWMDPRNIAWVTVAVILFTGLFLFCAYLIVRFGNFAFFHNFFKPSQVTAKKWPTHRKTRIRYSKNPSKDRWEPWRAHSTEYLARENVY